MKVIDAALFDAMLDEAVCRAHVLISAHADVPHNFAEEVRLACAHAIAASLTVVTRPFFVLVLEHTQTERGVTVVSIDVFARCGGAVGIIDGR